MGFRFHRSIKILPGIRLNISKKGVGVSAGVKGFRVSVGPAGVRRTMSIPGTGISKIDQITFPEQHDTQSERPSNQFSPPPVPPEVEEPMIISSSNMEPEKNPPKRISPRLAYTCSVGIIVTACIFMLLAALSTIPRKEPAKPSALSVDQVVGTMVAQTTQQAIVTQMFDNLTQTSQANQAFLAQTQAALIPTEVIVTNTPIQPLPQVASTVVRAISLPTVAPIPTVYSNPIIAPVPITEPENIVTEPTQSNTSFCCKVCTGSKACGDSCISNGKICHQPPGCACDG